MSIDMERRLLERNAATGDYAARRALDRFIDRVWPCDIASAVTEFDARILAAVREQMPNSTSLHLHGLIGVADALSLTMDTFNGAGGYDLGAVYGSAYIFSLEDAGVVRIGVAREPIQFKSVCESGRASFVAAIEDADGIAVPSETFHAWVRWRRRFELTELANGVRKFCNEVNKVFETVRRVTPGSIRSIMARRAAGSLAVGARITMTKARFPRGPMVFGFAGVHDLFYAAGRLGKLAIERQSIGATPWSERVVRQWILGRRYAGM